MEILLGILSALSGSFRTTDTANEDGQVQDRQAFPLACIGDFKPIEISPAVRPGTTCWTCGKPNDGHQHL